MLIQDWIDELGYEVVGPAQTVDQALAMIEQNRTAAVRVHRHVMSIGGLGAANLR